jgi:23S rRNA (guanosine2251-2'-O)-methyltransferase
MTADPAFVALLDGIEDPYNYGQAIRALFAAGADGVMARARSWESAAGIVARSSAGASELLPTAQVGSLDEAARLSHEAGMVVAVATTQRDATSLYEADLARPLLLIVGGERRGVTRSFVDAADLRIRIPYGRRAAHALGAATSAALIAFEVLRQRQAAGMDRGAGWEAVPEGSVVVENGGPVGRKRRAALHEGA